MRILLVLLISIVFVTFAVSFIALNTTWIEIGYKDISTFFMVKNINLASILILSSFLIAHAQYRLRLDGQSKKRMIQLLLGIFFGVMIIGKLLLSYYRLVYVQNWISNFAFSQEIKAKNTIADASRMYELHGVLIEYYDINKTKKMYEPTPTDIKIKERREMTDEEIHSIPVYLVMAFTIMIFAYWFGNLLANRSIKRKSNSHDET